MNLKQNQAYYRALVKAQGVLAHAVPANYQNRKARRRADYIARRKASDERQRLAARKARRLQQGGAK